MTIAFTICSINYLAQAHTLGESLAVTNPGIRFFVGLVDRLDHVQFDTGKEPRYELLEIHKIGIEGFGEMCGRYNITELNTAVKPFYFSYFWKEFPQAEKLIYFDPDIIVFQPLTALLQQLDTSDAVLTPHVLTPVEDRKTPNELHHLNTGVYNLGFVAFRKTEAARVFVKWWEDKLRYECLIALCEGLFVDQNWMNFLPVFVPGTYIERHPGYNVAYWNLHERTVSRKQDTYYVNEESELLFFHYSGYDPARPEVLSKYQDRFVLGERPDLHTLFAYYGRRLEANGQEYYRTFPCSYIKPPEVRRYQRVRKWLSAPLEKLADKLDTF